MMLYSDLVKKACNIMFEAHKNDFDKGGYPYVFHPFYLATQMTDEVSTCVALLHDVIEDHSESVSFSDLEKEGFPEAVISALQLLTHDKTVPYMEYVKRLASDPIARQVKLADLHHNMDTRRIDGERSKKYDLYLQAAAFLEKYSEDEKKP